MIELVGTHSLTSGEGWKKQTLCIWHDMNSHNLFVLYVCVSEKEREREREWAGTGSAPSHLGNTNQVLQLLPPQLCTLRNFPTELRRLQRCAVTGRSRSKHQRCPCSEWTPSTPPTPPHWAWAPCLHGSGRTIDSRPARCCCSSVSSSGRGSFPSYCPGSPQHSLRHQMAGHEWEDWFEREEFIGQISDIRVQNLQGRIVPPGSSHPAVV